MEKFVSKSENPYEKISKEKSNFTPISEIRVVNPFIDRTNIQNKNSGFTKVEENCHGKD